MAFNELTAAVIMLFGLIIGSFLNVVIYRLPQKEHFLISRSHCPKCSKILSWKELIPLISFLIQKGKCRSCRQPIRWQYPLVEFTTAILFVLLFAEFDISKKFFVYAVFVSILIVIFVIDLQKYLILDTVTIPALFAALIGNLILSEQSVASLFIGALIGGGIFLIQFLVSRGRWIGGGDIRLGALMGFILGWPVVVVALLLAYWSGAIVAATLLLSKKKKLADQIPFGTFLSASTIIVLLYSDYLEYWIQKVLYV